MEIERPEDCPSRIAVGAGSGFAAGAIGGGVAANWSDVPRVLRDRPWPALVRTGSVMAAYAATLGLVGASYAAVECAAEGARGKKDWVNGSLGGAAAGAVLGLRLGRLGAAVGAAAALAAASAAVDASGGRLSGQVVGDGETKRREIFPYNT